MAVSTTYDDKMFRFFDLRQRVSEMTQQYFDDVKGEIVTQEVPALKRNAIINEINSEIRKYLDAHAKKVANWTPSAAQQAKGVQRRYDVTKIEGLKNMAELRRGMQKLITEIAFKHASDLGTDPSGRQIYGLPQLQDVFPDFKVPLTATDLASATVGLGSSFKTVGGTRYDVTDMPSRNISEAERLLKASGVQTIDKDTLAGRVSYAVPDDAVVRMAGKPDELALDILQQVLSPTAVQSRYEAGVKSKTKELEDRQKATDKFTRKRINVTKGGLTRARINQLIAQGMTRAQARAEVRTPAEQEQLYNDALEAVLGGKNYASAGQVRNLSPELRVVQNAIRGAQASEAKIGDAAPFLERQTVADLKVRALKENAKEAEFMRQYQAYKNYGTPMSNAARRYFEQNADKDSGAALAAKTQALARRSFVVRKANVALAKDILSKKSQYGRRSSEVRWARDVMRRERDLKRGGGAFGRIFGGLPPALVPLILFVQLIAKILGTINETLNKVYKIVDQATGKARERQQEIDAVGLTQSQSRWAESMNRAYGYNFSGAYAQTAKSLSDIVSGEGGVENFITAMGLQGNMAGIDEVIKKSMSQGNTVAVTHAAIAGALMNSIEGKSLFNPTASVSPEQALLEHKQRLEKYVGAENATLLGQLFTQYKSLSKEQQAQIRSDYTEGKDIVKTIADTTGAAGIVAASAASTQMMEGLSEMGKMLKTQKDLYESDFTSIREQASLTWGQTASAWQQFTQNLKKGAAHLLTGTTSSVTEASSDAAKYSANKEHAIAARRLAEEQTPIIRMIETQGVLGGTKLKGNRWAEDLINTDWTDRKGVQGAWELYYSELALNLNEQEQNELMSYMYARTVQAQALKKAKEAESANEKDKPKFIIDADEETIIATAYMLLEQAGFATNKRWGIGSEEAMPIKSVLGLEGETADKTWAKDLESSARLSGAVSYGADLKTVLDAAAAAGYTGTTQEVKVDVQAGKMYIEFDDPNTGRRRVESKNLGVSWYDEHTNRGGSTGDFNEAMNALNVPSVQNK